jgi:hypothetical protein
MERAVYDACVPEGVEYADANHLKDGKPVRRTVYGLDAPSATPVRVCGIYSLAELKDDRVPRGVVQELVGRPWAVELIPVTAPSNQSGPSHQYKWYFGNFSLKASGTSRHADFYVRLNTEDRNLDFFKKLDACSKPVNTWTRVVPGTSVSYSCCLNL